MKTSTIEANAAHAESNAVYERFIANGGKVITELHGNKSQRCSINSKARAKPKSSPILVGLTNIQKVERVIKQFGSVNRLEIEEQTGVDKSEIFRAVGILEKRGVITRKTGKAAVPSIFTWVGQGKVSTVKDELPISKATCTRVINALTGRKLVEAPLLAKLTGLHLQTVYRATRIMTSEGLITSVHDDGDNIVRFYYSLA